MTGQDPFAEARPGGYPAAPAAQATAGLPAAGAAIRPSSASGPASGALPSPPQHAASASAPVQDATSPSSPVEHAGTSRVTLADRARPASTGLPFSALLGLVAGLAIFATSQTPLRDIDVFWHVLAGQQLLTGVAPDDVGTTWSFAPSSLPWTSTQWLAEILFAALYQAFGWTGLAGFRVVTAAAAIGVLALATLRGRPRAIAGFPFLMATAMLAFVSQDRPAQFTLIGAAALGGVLVAGLTSHQLPRWYLLLPATTLWANLHGGWVLVPGVLLLIGAGVALDSGVRVPLVRRAVLLAAATTAAGCLTPSGIGGLTAPLRFSEAADLIREWAPVEPASTLGWMTLAMLSLFLVGWAAGRQLPRSEALVVMALLCFTWLANRNLAPGLALMAPLAAHGLCRAFPGIGRPEPRWSTPLGVTLAAVLTVAGVVSVATTPNLPSASQPLSLVQRIAALPPGQRVLNDYNTSGIVLFFGGPQTKVAIDGRTDRYGADYIQRYVALNALRGDWEPLLAQLRPTVALLDVDAPLTHLLMNERGWHQIGPVEANHVLLVPPTRAENVQPAYEPGHPTAGPVRGTPVAGLPGTAAASLERASAQGNRTTNVPTESPKPAASAKPAPTARPADSAGGPVAAITSWPPAATTASGSTRPRTCRPSDPGSHASTTRSGPAAASSRVTAGTTTICPTGAAGSRMAASPDTAATPSTAAAPPATSSRESRMPAGPVTTPPSGSAARPSGRPPR